MNDMRLPSENFIADSESLWVARSISQGYKLVDDEPHTLTGRDSSHSGLQLPVSRRMRQGSSKDQVRSRRWPGAFLQDPIRCHRPAAVLRAVRKTIEVSRCLAAVTTHVSTGAGRSLHVRKASLVSRERPVKNPDPVTHRDRPVQSLSQAGERGLPLRLDAQRVEKAEYLYLAMSQNVDPERGTGEKGLAVRRILK